MFALTVSNKTVNAREPEGNWSTHQAQRGYGRHREYLDVSNEWNVPLRSSIIITYTSSKHIYYRSSIYVMTHNWGYVAGNGNYTPDDTLDEAVSVPCRTHSRTVHTWWKTSFHSVPDPLYFCKPASMITIRERSVAKLIQIVGFWIDISKLIEQACWVAFHDTLGS